MTLSTVRGAPTANGLTAPHPDPIDRESLSDFLLLTYDVAIGDAGWPRLAGRLSELVGGQATALFVLGSRPDSFELLASAGEPSAAFVRQCVHAAHERIAIASTACRNEISQPRAGGAPWGRMLEKAPSYVAGVPLGPGGDEYLCVGCATDFSEAADVVAAQVEMVLPYLSRAFEIGRRLNMAAAQSRANEAILDRVPFGLFQLDSRGMVVSANAHALRMAKLRKGLTVTANAVHAAASGDEARLQRAITEVLASGGASSQRVSVSCGADIPPYSVLVSSIAPNSISLSARTACVLFVTDPEAQPSPSAQAIVQAFGLTPAEARIASGLAMGVSLPATAAKLGISINTARTLLSRAMAKTSTNSQLSLVRLVLTGLTLIHVSE